MESVAFLNQNILNYQFPSLIEFKLALDSSDALQAKTRYFNSFDGEFYASENRFENATVSCTSVEYFFPEIKKFCNEMSRAFDMRVQCNAYITPPKAQGLPLHYDLHDVFVVQIEGSKNWKTWDRIRSTVSVQTLISDQEHNLNVWTNFKKPKEFKLKPWETLYLKLGVPHECWSSEEESYHLTFGLYND